MVSIAAAACRRALQETAENLYTTYGVSAIGSDPVALVRRQTSNADREVAAWIASAFAYGRVETILRNVGSLLGFLGSSPSRAVAENRFSPEELSFFRHRFHGPGDAAGLLTVIGETIRRYGSVGGFFESHFDPREPDVGGLLSRAAGELATWVKSPSPYFAFLFPKPSEGSACKRWNLQLRWMVRRDQIDFGLWTRIPPSALVIPTDTHVHRVARRLGLTRRRTADWKTALEITESLKRLDPADPVKYDFALCRLGILEICRVEPRLSECPSCPARGVCPIGRRRLRAESRAA
jgi:uncharacterized protein (TIGR02757 family)